MISYTNGGASISIQGQETLGVDAGKEYERVVVGTLDTIQCSQVGKLLVQSLQRQLTIVPYAGTGLNAQAIPDSTRAAGEKGAIQYSKGVMQVKNGAPLRYSRGGGSSSTIQFTPTLFQTSGVADKTLQMIRAGLRRDEILFHEMTHATHHMAGKMNRSDAPPGFDSKEEFWAIMLTNVYASAWNRPLRKNHHGHRFISLPDAQAFFAKYSTMVDWMSRDMPVLSRGIADLAWIAFNPLRDSYVRRTTFSVTSQQTVIR